MCTPNIWGKKACFFVKNFLILWWHFENDIKSQYRYKRGRRLLLLASIKFLRTWGPTFGIITKFMHKAWSSNRECEGFFGCFNMIFRVRKHKIQLRLENPCIRISANDKAKDDTFSRWILIVILKHEIGITQIQKDYFHLLNVYLFLFWCTFFKRW